MKWTIKNKLISIGVLAIIALGMMFLISYQSSLAIEESTQLSRLRKVQIEQLRNLQLNQTRLTLVAMDLIIDAEADILRKKELSSELDEIVKLIQTDQNGLDDLADTQEEKRLVAEISKDLGKLINDIQNGLLVAVMEGRIDDMDQYDDDIDNGSVAITEDISLVVESVKSEVKEAGEEVASTISSSTVASLITFLVAASLLSFFLFFITRGVITPLGEAVKMIKQMAVGNLRSRLKSESKDELGEMSRSMDTLADNLTGFVGMMNEVASGNLDIDWEIKDPEDQIAPGLYNILTSLRELIAETKMLINAAVDGSLSVRGDESKFKGGYLEIVQGVNNTLDAVIGPVQEGSDVLKVMATGDLTVRVTGDYKGDHQLIKNSINSLGDSVGGLIKQLTEAVEATASASTQISSSAEEMAAGAQEQSSQTAEVAAAMEEMSRTIVETANNATVSAEASQEASKKATEGATKLEESKEGMQRIVTSTDTVGKNITSLASKSEQIGEIAQVIDDIADQTNLLALNAAIEAARAGEHGRGFAVVADEVRKLAENTTKATQEIANTIKAIQSEAKDADTSMKEAGEAVKEGLRLNDQVGDVLGDILSSVDSVTGQISQVAAASEEQSATAEQVSTNVEAINNVANESAAGVQQIASASEDLNRLTENLSGLVAQFKVDNRNSQNYSVGHNGNLLSE